MTATRIIIFAKAPVPGKVKTRLIPVLGAEGAARLAREMLQQTIEEALAADLGKPEICTDPDPRDQAWDGLLPSAFDLSGQGDGDLGQRLARAAERGLTENPSVLMIGTDCPALNRHLLREMAGWLAPADAVICPAEDGGYVALGLRKYDPAIFRQISWSSPSVARETIDRIGSLGWTLQIGPTFQDIDIPADLARMATK